MNKPDWACNDWGSHNHRYENCAVCIEGYANYFGYAMANLVILEVSQLKTVEQHNTEKIAARQERERQAKATGVACPKCGKELQFRFTCWEPIEFPKTTSRVAECVLCNLTVKLEI